MGCKKNTNVGLPNAVTGARQLGHQVGKRRVGLVGTTRGDTYQGRERLLRYVRASVRMSGLGYPAHIRIHAHARENGQRNISLRVVFRGFQLVIF
jgi:hypothetical protein